MQTREIRLTYFGIDKLPEPERGTAAEAQTLLLTLESHLTGVAAAIALFHHSRELCREDSRNRRSTSMQPFHLWGQIAARDAAISIHDFTTAVGKIREDVLKLPSLQFAVDASLLNRAAGLRTTYFPGSREARNGVAHSSDAFTTEYDAHKIKPGQSIPGVVTDNPDGPVGSYFSGVSGDVGITTYQGKVHKTPMTQETLARMEEIIRMLHDALAGVERWARLPKEKRQL
jgi:hypothetical protein